MALLVLLPVAVFASSLDNGFHLDDFYRIVDNPGIRQVAPMGRHFTDPSTNAWLPRLVQYRPLLPLTLSWNHALTGDDPAGYRWGNLALHIGVVLLTWRLFLALLRDASAPAGRSGAALAAALLFALHPVSGVPINYLCARDLVLMQFFLVAMLLAWVSLRRGRFDGLGRPLGAVVGWTLALGALILSLLGKTNAVVAPLLILCLELCAPWRPVRVSRDVGGADSDPGSSGPASRWGRAWTWLGRGQPGEWARALLRALPFAAVVAGFFLFTERVLGFSDVEQLGMPETSWDHRLAYLWTQLDLHVTYYLRNVVWSGSMRPLPDVGGLRGLGDVGSWIGLGVVLLGVGLAWRWRRRRPGVAFALLAWFVLWIPTSSLAPLRYLATDYRAYPSLAFLLLALVVAVGAALPARARRPALVLGLLGCAAGSLGQNAVWQDEQSLWGHAVRLGARPMAHVNYAKSIQARAPDEARRHYQYALSVDAGDVVAGLNLGLLEIGQGHADVGLAHIERAVAAGSTWSQAHHWHAQALLDLGRIDEAALAAERAALLQPDHAAYLELALTTLYRSGFDAGRRGDHALCVDRFARLHALVDVRDRSRFSEGFALQQLGRYAEAVESYSRHLAAYPEGDPDEAQVRFNRAVALRFAGRHAEAVDELRRCLALDPERRIAHLHLAESLWLLGREEESRAHRKAYELGDPP